MHFEAASNALRTQFALKMRYVVCERSLEDSAMGPFTHGAPPATISTQNPVGTDGFEFVEFAHPQPEALAALFWRMGYVPVAKHRTKNITLWRQGDINYIVNAEPGSFATR